MAQWLGRVNASAALTLLPPHGHKRLLHPPSPVGWGTLKVQPFYSE